MHHQRQATDSAEWDDLGLAPESTPHGLMGTGSFPKETGQAPDDPMGPFPEASVQVFADLGLSSAEIAQYFGVTEKRVIDLKDGRDHQAAKGRLREFSRTVRGKLLDSADR